MYRVPGSTARTLVAGGGKSGRCHERVVKEGLFTGVGHVATVLADL